MAFVEPCTGADGTQITTLGNLGVNSPGQTACFQTNGSGAMKCVVSSPDAGSISHNAGSANHKIGFIVGSAWAAGISDLFMPLMVRMDAGRSEGIGLRYNGTNLTWYVMGGGGNADSFALALSPGDYLELESAASNVLNVRHDDGGGLTLVDTRNYANLYGNTRVGLHQAISAQTINPIGDDWMGGALATAAARDFSPSARGIARGIGRGIARRTFVDLGRLLVPARRLILPPGLVAAI